MARVGAGAGGWVGVRPEVGWWEGVSEKRPAGAFCKSNTLSNFSIFSWI
jgi:hypothetical protein